MFYLVNKMDTYNVCNTSVSFQNNSVEINLQNRFDGSLPHYQLLDDLMCQLKQNGFYIENDKTVSEIIRKDYWYGKYHDLEFKAHRYPAGFKIVFYQNLHFEHCSGGYYDSNKLNFMPYLQKLIFKKTVNQIILFFEEHKIKEARKPAFKKSEDNIRYDYLTSFHHSQTDMNFSLSDLIETTPDTCESNCLDRNKKILHNGQVKYFRNQKGYLMRGTVYHNINNMWWVILNKYEYINVACFDLFDLSKDDMRGRLVKENIPAAFIQRREHLQGLSTKELENELKRRKKVG